MIILALALIGSTAPWPGVWALLVSLATAGLILGGQHRIWMSALGASPACFVDRFCYSLCLVRWPAIVFYRDWSIIPPTPIELAGLEMATLLFRTALHYMVEQPFRKRGRSSIVHEKPSERGHKYKLERLST